MKPFGIILLISLCASWPFASTPVFAQASAVQPRITRALDESQLATLRGNTHPLARAEFDRGQAPPDLPMQRMLLVLRRSPEQEATLKKLLEDQQDKAAPSFHKWLTPADFGQQFGPADQDIQTVTAWLQSHGFQVARVSKGRSVIEFSGNVAQVQEAFHTSIHKFTVNGEDHWANASDPQIPAALTSVVAGIHTLHNFLKKPQVHIAEEKIAAKLVPGAPGRAPQVTFPGTPAMHALGPWDFATIYNVPSHQANGLSAGNGSSIAVVARSDIDPDDLADFTLIFDRGMSIQTVLNGPDPGNLGGGEEAEAMLDATWASTIGLGASVSQVVSASTNTTDGG
jgi:subtilase family serine protease